MTSSLDESILVSAEYCQKTKELVDALELEAKTQRENFDAVVAEVRPVLDCVDMEVAPQPDDRPDSVSLPCN